MGEQESAACRDGQYVATARNPVERRLGPSGEPDPWVRLTIERAGERPLDVEVPREWLERASKVGA